MHSDFEKNSLIIKEIASVFSRSVFLDILRFKDFQNFNELIFKYKIAKSQTYLDILNSIYRLIRSNYRCEYIYKNEIIKYLLKTNINTVYFSEFKSNKSIADIVTFNGESKCFEIKTEYDSTYRLNKQLIDYKNLFDKYYVVTSEKFLQKAMNYIKDDTGIIILYGEKAIHFEEFRPSFKTNSFSIDSMLSCLRLNECIEMIVKFGVPKDKIPYYNLPQFAKGIFAYEDSEIVRNLFITQVKKRRNNEKILKDSPSSIKQMVLSLNLKTHELSTLLNSLNSKIK